MISRVDINDRVREWGLREDIVEKDHVIGWILWGIGNDSLLKSTWCFKGGTCIKKCYIETYRFSEDLDFTVTPGGPIEPADLSPLFDRILNRVSEASGIDFAAQSPIFQKRSERLVTVGRIYYRGPRNAPGVARIKLDLSAEEIIARPTVFRDFVHPYPDEFPSPRKIRCYSFEEVFAEKIRALGERCRPRDLMM